MKERARTERTRLEEAFMEARKLIGDMLVRCGEADDAESESESELVRWARGCRSSCSGRDSGAALCRRDRTERGGWEGERDLWGDGTGLYRLDGDEGREQRDDRRF
jgi:hypothetical protein